MSRNAKVNKHLVLICCAPSLPGSSTTCLTWVMGRVCWRATVTVHWMTTSGTTWSSRATLPTHTRSRWTQNQSPRMSMAPKTWTSKVPHFYFQRHSEDCPVQGLETWVRPESLTKYFGFGKVERDMEVFCHCCRPELSQIKPTSDVLITALSKLNSLASSSSFIFNVKAWKWYNLVI